MLSGQSFKEAYFPVDIYAVGSLSAALTFSQSVAQGTPRGGGPPSFLTPPHLTRRLAMQIYFKIPLCYGQCFNREEDVVETVPVMALQLEAHAIFKLKEEWMAEIQSD
ncbi:hypothetical protein CDAR_7361 [Caerostris darwini]|uniref:Uncharacterized protein n=1 Tax=Caerostris darwini TaxID=1538125 RepID=A0AAV4RTX0_9ARAC|nr:hypothetical protein CDAR_7361 [Caerostris darwini]